MNEGLKERIEQARRIQEEFQKLGENIEPEWLLLSEARAIREGIENFRSEMKTAIIGFGEGILGAIIAFGIAILVHVI